MDESEENGLPFGAMEPQLRKKARVGKEMRPQWISMRPPCFCAILGGFFLQYRLNANEWMDGQTLL